MSRIEEAKRRASRAGVVDIPQAPAAAPRPDGATLDHYPEEQEAGRAGRIPEPPVARRVPAAPARPASVPAAPLPRSAQAARHTFDPRRDPRLVGSSEISGMAVEQYRRLAAAVHEHQLERGLGTLMVTSAVPDEGKTLTVVNLALTLSESFGRRVLLIDGDLRRPSLHQIFGLPNTNGLSEWLRSERSDLPVRAVSARLSVLPGGQPDANPMAGLTSERMTRLLKDASSQFDWVLVDAPPVLMLPDAQLLARVTHAVVFVIRAGFTPLVSVQKAIDAIGRDYIIGTLLNHAEDYALPATEGYDRYGHYAARGGVSESADKTAR